MKSSVLTLVAALSASPTLAGQDGYPSGLFENSPVVPGPGESNAQGPPDAAGSTDANGSLDDFCDSIASRTFHSLAEVKRAHAKCDPPTGDPPPDQ